MYYFKIKTLTGIMEGATERDPNSFYMKCVFLRGGVGGLVPEEWSAKVFGCGPFTSQAR